MLCFRVCFYVRFLPLPLQVFNNNKKSTPTSNYFYPTKLILSFLINNLILEAYRPGLENVNKSQDYNFNNFNTCLCSANVLISRGTKRLQRINKLGELQRPLQRKRREGFLYLVIYKQQVDFPCCKI